MEPSLEHAPQPLPGDPGLRWRRTGFAVAVSATAAGLLWLMANTLFVSGVDAIGLLMLLAFAVTLPWTAIGFWNAAIGLGLMVCSRDAAGLVAPHLHAGGPAQPIDSSTALLSASATKTPGACRATWPGCSMTWWPPAMHRRFTCMC